MPVTITSPGTSVVKLEMSRVSIDGDRDCAISGAGWRLATSKACAVAASFASLARRARSRIEMSTNAL
ncbi:hypothetical protein [Rhodosalinus sp.]|uniref:hypothetical protein n=1 Tax=Rhodosalinus sp. TaxID=2047741 RepID=UPI00397D7A17